MNTKILSACLIGGALMLPVAGYAADSDSDRSSPKTFVKDSVITAKVKTELAESKISSIVHISVDTDKMGAVSLKGTVKSQAEMDKVVSIALGVKGVTSVHNDIRVKAD